MAWSRQGNQVVGDHDKGPVCLDALPGTHKHVAEGQVLLDVLVKDLDSKTLAVKSDHLGFAHLKVVGNQESGFLGPAFGDKQEHSADLGQMDDSLGDLEPSLLGKTHSLVSPRSLGQVTDDGLPAVHFQDAVAFDRRYESPTPFDNRNKDGSAGIPTVHQYCHRGANLLAKILKDFLGQLNFAFEFALGTRGLWTIAFHSPGQPLSGDLQNAGHGALALDQSIGRMVNAQAFDLFAVPGASSVVDGEDDLWQLVGLLGQKILVGFLKTRSLFDRTIEKPLQVVGKHLDNLTGNFPRGMKLDEPDQTDQVNQEVFDLGFAQHAQEISQSGRSFLRDNFSHGFRALLALLGIGDFGRKPFCLKDLSLSVT